MKRPLKPCSQWIVRTALLAALVVVVPDFATAQETAATDKWGQARARRDGELDRLKDETSQVARKRWPNGVDTKSKEYQDFMADYSNKKAAINTKYVNESGLPDEIEQLKGKGLKPSGNTKLQTLDSDIDMVSDSDETVDQLADEWEKKYGKDSVVRDKASGKIVNKRTNTTVWRPDPDNRYEAGRIADPMRRAPSGGAIRPECKAAMPSRITLARITTTRRRSRKP